MPDGAAPGINWLHSGAHGSLPGLRALRLPDEQFDPAPSMGICVTCPEEAPKGCRLTGPRRGNYQMTHWRTP